MEKSLLLWLNSTLGALLLIGFRVEQQGAWVNLKKPSLHSMPALDLRRIPEAVIRGLESSYDTLCRDVLLPLPHMPHDPVRRKIDSAVEDALSLPSLAPLREMLAREPNISLAAL